MVPVQLGQRVVETDSTIAKLQARKRGYQSLPPVTHTTQLLISEFLVRVCRISV